MPVEARDRWAAMGRRERGALVDAVRAGRAVDRADAAVAVAFADRELARLARVARPWRLNIWRALHGLAALWFLVLALPQVAAGYWLAAAVCGAFSAVFAASAVLARRRLARRTGLVTRSRNLNA
ncbi:MAG: hypothetical protein QOE45_3429 [Frankiaceae bacterium]|nr:hypothetical protein [Frankiaceae bacterium]